MVDGYFFERSGQVSAAKAGYAGSSKACRSETLGRIQRMDEWITKACKAGALILLGWFGSSAYHHTLTAHQAEKVLPVVAAEAGCEHWRAETNAKVAKQAIVGAVSDNAPIPDPKAVVKDKCPHVAVK